MVHKSVKPTETILCCPFTVADTVYNRVINILEWKNKKRIKPVTFQPTFSAILEGSFIYHSTTQGCTMKRKL